MQIQSFHDICSRYKVIFFDSYGVLKNYRGLIEGVPEMLEALKRIGIDYYVLTNDASRGPELMEEKFRNMGLHHLEIEKVITSGMMAKEYLRYKVKSGKVAYLGPKRSAYYIESLGLEAIHTEDLPKHDPEDIKAFLFLDDEGFEYNSAINLCINLLRKHNIPAIVANTDKVYPASRDEVALAIGGIAKLIENIVQKKFIYFGKPDSQMFMYAFQKLEGVSKNEILMVGDTLQTDILGGNKFGIDTALVLSGNTSAHKVKARIRSTGIIPTHVCESVGK
ncbi:MAG: HAD-IIA family hydrolase [Bacteroidota bacterium]